MTDLSDYARLLPHLPPEQIKALYQAQKFAIEKEGASFASAVFRVSAHASGQLLVYCEAPLLRDEVAYVADLVDAK